MNEVFDTLPQQTNQKTGTSVRPTSNDNIASKVDNFAQLVLDQILKHPDRIAIYNFRSHKNKVSTSEHSVQHQHITYRELGRQVTLYQKRLQQLGLRPGQRVLMIVMPSADFFPLVIAMTASGLIPVFIDPRIGYFQIIKALKATHISAVICDPLFKKWKWLFFPLWRIPCYSLGVQSLNGDETNLISMSKYPSSLEGRGSYTYKVLPCDLQSPAIITYTSGTTGIPKGVIRPHFKLIKQFKIVHRLSPPESGDVGLTFLHMAAIHGLCLGVSTVMPDFEIRKGSLFDPAKTLAQVNQFKVTCLGGAPYFIEKQIDYMQAVSSSPSNIRLVVLGSAGTSPSLVKKIQRQLPLTDIQICYGATEAEPISFTTGVNLLKAYRSAMLPPTHKGYYVGRPSKETEVIVVDQKRLEILPKSSIGEIWVSGPQVLDSYTDVNTNSQRKYRDLQGTTWHRTGDRGCMDTEGGIWLVGRSGDEIHLPTAPDILIDPFPIEIAINELEWIKASALIQSIPNQSDERSYDLNTYTCLFCELTQDRSVSKDDDYIKLVKEKLTAFHLEKINIMFLNQLPVDWRHFSKIDRNRLRKHLKKYHRRTRVRQWAHLLKGKKLER